MGGFTLKPNQVLVIETLNEASDVSRSAGPWIGVLWLCALPLRFLQIYFYSQLGVLGKDAGHYGDYLHELAFCTFGAFILGTYGRAVYVRACFLGIQSGRTAGVEALRVPLADGMTYLYLALLIESAFFVLALTFVGIPVTIVFAALAAALAYGNDRPSLIAPLKELGQAIANPKVPLLLFFLFAIAFLIVWINSFFFARAALWLAGGISGLDLSRWDYIFRGDQAPWPVESLPRILLMAGSGLLIEPFWIAAHVVYIHKLKARQTGEDLRREFEQLRAKATRTK